MKTKRLLSMAALSTAAVIILAGCGKTEEVKNPVPLQNNNSVVEAPANSSAPSAREVVKLTKEEVEKIVFAQGFDSTEYLALIQQSAQNAQMEMVNRELYEKKDVKACDKLSEDSLKNNCKNNFFYSQAQTQKDASFCAKISEESTKKSCSDSVIFQKASSEGKAELCESLTEEGMKDNCKNSVYMETARKAGDASICDKLTQDSYKDMCKNEVKMIAEEKARQAEYEAQSLEAEKEAQAVAAPVTEEVLEAAVEAVVPTEETPAEPAA